MSSLSEINKDKKSSEFIPRLIDVVIPDVSDHSQLDQVFLVMQSGEMDLRSFMFKAKNLQFGKDHLRITIYNLLCAISYCHSSNIIHRDIKPANILINSRCQVRICDFGLARTLPEQLIGKGSGNSKRVRDSIMKHQINDDVVKNQIKDKLQKDIEKRQRKKRSISSHITSRWYRAPEVILLEKQYDQAIDMWAIGCVIFELIKFQNRSSNKECTSTNKAVFQG
jgi:mitogen-activated protein kinase 1/3